MSDRIEWKRTEGGVFAPFPAPDEPLPPVEPLPPPTSCAECGGPLTRHTSTFSTCVGYFSPPGHDHDNNCKSRVYRCAAGHETPLLLAPRCPADGCDWRGKRSCSGCRGAFVDEWPTLVRRTDE